MSHCRWSNVKRTHTKQSVKRTAVMFPSLYAYCHRQLLFCYSWSMLRKSHPSPFPLLRDMTTETKNCSTVYTISPNALREHHLFTTYTWHLMRTSHNPTLMFVTSVKSHCSLCRAEVFADFRLKYHGMLARVLTHTKPHLHFFCARYDVLTAVLLRI